MHDLIWSIYINIISLSAALSWAVFSWDSKWIAGLCQFGCWVRPCKTLQWSTHSWAGLREQSINADECDHVCLVSICYFQLVGSFGWIGCGSFGCFFPITPSQFPFPMGIRWDIYGPMDLHFMGNGMAFPILHPGASHDSLRSVVQSRTSCMRVDRTTATSPVAGSKYSWVEDRLYMASVW